MKAASLLLAVALVAGSALALCWRVAEPARRSSAAPPHRSVSSTAHLAGEAQEPGTPTRPMPTFRDLGDRPALPQELEMRGGRRGDRRGFPGRSREPTAFVPDWTLEPEFASDAFTFARVEYTSARRRNGYRRGFFMWDTDYPDADNNFSYRLHELTSLRVTPQTAVVRFDQPEIFDYPFVYLVEAGHMALTNEEVAGLRKYLLRGGFLMVDDFWGDWALEGLLENLLRAFPDRQPVELPIEHEIFHIVYDIQQKPMVPSIHAYYRGNATDFPELPDAYQAHYLGLFDDQGRMMMIICHNTDLGDGWEREGVEEGYFKTYSERWAYPLGINIITYAMTH